MLKIRYTNYRNASLCYSERVEQQKNCLHSASKDVINKKIKC